MRDVVKQMANGKCEPKVYLSAIDCGGGRSQSVAHFLRALPRHRINQDVGMIVCVGRIAEAEAMAREAAGIRDRIAVLTSNDDANALSGTDPANAQALITTQQSGTSEWAVL